MRRPTKTAADMTMENSVMQKLRQIQDGILATGRIDAPELEVLSRHVYADGKIDRTTADFLVELHRRVQPSTPAFERFFYKAIKDHLLADGWIDAADAAWLRRMLDNDGKIDDEERKFLHGLKQKAKKVSREFERLFAECMQRPQEAHAIG